MDEEHAFMERETNKLEAKSRNGKKGSRVRGGQGKKLFCVKLIGLLSDS